MEKVNWLAILASVIAATVLGFLWYGYLFLDQWMAGNNMTMDEAGKMFKNGIEFPRSQMPMVINTLSNIVIAFFMHWLINKTGDTTWKKGGILGLAIGAISWLGIIVANLFANNPFSLSTVDGSYNLILWTIFGAIIGGLRK